MNNKSIQLTEQDLHMLVEDAVKTYLTENELGEGVWGGLKNVWQGAKNWNFNVGQTYKAGNWASSFNSYAQEAQNALVQMKTIAQQTKNQTIAKQLGSISTMLGRAAAGYTKMANQVAKGTPMNTSVQDPWAAKAAKKQAGTQPAATATPTAAGTPAAGTAVPGAATTTATTPTAAGTPAAGSRRKAAGA